ncbi:MAG: phosphotriesterase [Dehalococcoidia bacterium]
MALINSVLGPLDSANLGFTLPHEHLIDSSAGIPNTYDELINRERALETATEELTRAHAEGVNTIVEVSPLDLGRDVLLMRQVSQRTGVQFICCTGCWLDVPRSFWGRTPEFIAALWAREIEEGIEGTGIKAGIIKVATSDPISEQEELMLRSAAATHRKTGVPITTHTPAQSRIGERQVDILKEEGVEPKNVYVGHINNTLDKEYHRNLVKQGAWLGWDINHPFGRPHLPPWQQQIDYLKGLLDEDLGSNLMLSHDWNVVLSRVPTPGFPTREENPDGYLWITRAILPRLRGLGVSEELIHQMTVGNPRQYFEGG